MQRWILAFLGLVLVGQVTGADVATPRVLQLVPRRSILTSVTASPSLHLGHLGLRGGSAPAPGNPDDVGKQFVTYYYQTFDSNRAGLASLYQEVLLQRSRPAPNDHASAVDTRPCGRFRASPSKESSSGDRALYHRSFRDCRSSL